MYLNCLPFSTTKIHSYALRMVPYNMLYRSDNFFINSLRK